MEPAKNNIISDIGEFGLIDRIKRIDPVRGGNVLVGIGDDAAAINIQGNRILLTTDTLVEGVHFSRKYFTFFELGWKLMAVNLSDIAAMGGVPRHAVVTMGLKKNVKVSDIEDLYRGIKALATKYNVKVVGGDIVRSPGNLFFSMTLLGSAKKIITRSGARPGDAIVSTGYFGGSAAGLAALKKNVRKGSCVKDHLMPVPMVKEGLLAAKYATAMIDNSDGLARCLIEICKASKVGANIYSFKIPLARGANLEHALNGGEDYNLVMTVPKRKVSMVKSGKVIGEITGGRDIVLTDKMGRTRCLKGKGYEHI